jgi:protein-disulfide isomerase
MKTCFWIILSSLIHIPMGFTEPLPKEDLNFLRATIQELQAGQKAIQKDLQEIKALLNTRKQPSPSVQNVDLTLNISEGPSKGSKNAQVVLIEFTDYQCPYCARHSTSVLPQIEKYFIETGKIQYILRDFPIASLHPHAGKAHEAAHCAGEQGKYWEMHDQLFAHQKALKPEYLPEYSGRAGVSDRVAFEGCVESGKYHQRAQENIAEGAKAGVRGTPSFLLGLKTDEGKVQAIKLIRGAQSYSVFQEQIEHLLSSVD